MFTESLATTANMSAHETTLPWHAVFTADLTWSMTSNPLTELMFGRAVFSPWEVGVSSNRSDPSQPCQQPTPVN